MRKGLLFPVMGSVWLPAVAGIGVIVPLLFPSGMLEFYERLIFELAYSIPLFLCFYETYRAYEIIQDAQVPSVMRIKKAMDIGIGLFSAFLAILFLPLIISKLVSTEVPFYEVVERVGTAFFLSWAFVFGVCSLIVWDRWSFISQEELDMRYWERLSRREMIRLICGTGALASLFLGVWVPPLGLALFVTTSVPFAVLTLTGRKSEVEERPAFQGPADKVDLRRVGHEEKLSIGRQVCDLVLRQYGRKRVHGVCIWGDTPEDSSLPYSSLDFLVIVRDGVRLPSEQYVFGGLLVGIYYWQEIQILNRAREFDESWPWNTNRYRRRVILFEKKDWFAKLDRALEESDKADITEPIRDTALMLVEHFGDLRNARLKNDESGVKIASTHIAWDTVTLVLLLNRRYVRKDWEEVLECQAKPSDFRRSFETAVGFTSAPLEERIQASEKLAEESLELVRTRRISLASSQLRV